MTLSYLKVILVGTAGVAGTAGTIYVGGKAIDFSSVTEDSDEIIHTVKDKFKSRLISKSKFKGWKERFTKLQSDDSQDLHEGLKKIKTKGDPKASEDDLEKWCNDSYIEPYEEGSALIKGIDKYCTYLIKDQITSLITGTEEKDWSEAKKKLESLDDKNLSEEMKQIKKEKKLNDWCLEQYEKPFKDVKDPLYLEVAKFCKKIKTPQTPKSTTSGPVSSNSPGK
ncbi:hypothetical protein MHC_02875 [Mycoplasma haemocanis str. Illinois]|uniref:Uncharacterized protein n=1 Tax=Mycoplasma haemocanis (strain Illinois) TaxID=1111676 RepID=H6N715_MYCHN|nr:hypothetical protein [Mycoplasma haemocanis]AEW45437.1 hypothetical protein MHC_02875 [Mycoplasma haemocanis str. Illinois]